MTPDLPSDKEIVAFIRKHIKQNARDNDGNVTATVRQIRAALAEDFSVDDAELKEHKSKLIKSACQEAVEQLGEDNSEEPESSEPKSGGSSERKSPSEEPALDSDMSELDDTDPEDSSSKRPRKAKARGASVSTKKRASPKSGDKPRKSSTSATDKSDDEVSRLKKFVVACGVRKQWKNYFSSQSPPAETPSAQVKVLRSLLAELGMTGRLGMDKARKIREEREFKEEMRAIGADVAGSDDEGGGRKKRSAAKASRKAVAESDDDDDEGDDDDDDDKEEEEVRPPKKTKFNASLAAFAAELNSDDDDD